MCDVVSGQISGRRTNACSWLPSGSSGRHAGLEAAGGRQAASTPMPAGCLLAAARPPVPAAAVAAWVASAGASCRRQCWPKLVLARAWPLVRCNTTRAAARDQVSKSAVARMVRLCDSKECKLNCTAALPLAPCAPQQLRVCVGSSASPARLPARVAPLSDFDCFFSGYCSSSFTCSCITHLCFFI